METKRIQTDLLLISALIFLITVMSDRYLLPFFSMAGLPVYAGIGLTRIAGCAGIGGLIFYFHRTLAPAGLSLSETAHGIRRGLLYTLLFAAAAASGFLVLWLYGIENPARLIHTRLPVNTYERLFFFITGGILAPLLEELFFRGILYNYLKRWGVIVAVIFSTAAFAAIHSTGSSIPVTQIVGGLVFALSYEKEKSLLVPIIIHSSGNIAIFSLSLL